VVLSPKIQDVNRLRLANIQEERMVTGAIKNKVDKIWTDIWAGGITNPLTVIEQLTYLMFIRSLDEKELATEEFESMAGEKMEHIFPASEAGQSMRWSKFKDKDSREIFLTMQQRVFPAIKKMKYGRLPDFDENGELVEIEDDPTRPDEGNTAFARYMDDAMFLIPTPQVLQKIITGLEDLYTHDIADLDMQGDLYEYMLGKLATAGRNGQFRTPLHIIDMMVELVQPTPDDFICDPACGTAGFLVSSAQYLREHYEDTMTPEQWQYFAGPMFTGFDMDRTMLRISAMNLMLHSITNPDIDYKDSVSKQNSIRSKYTVCLANPPFKGTVDAESINDDLKAVTNTKKTELLFLALFLRMLKTGGRCACIVPDGVLFGSSKAHQSIRKELIENHQLRAVISMPSGVFKPYAGVSTAVLVFTKTGAGGTDKVWFYDMKADGFSLDDKRTEVKENDIPDIIARFHNLNAEVDRKRTEQSFFVPKAEIAANGYDLSINKYKETEYVPVEYPSTTEILSDLHELEMEITKGLAELEEMV
jgi:type I restriction enzyme M protein